MTQRPHESPPPRSWVARVFTWENAIRTLGAGGFVFLLLGSGVEKPAYMVACVGLMVSPSALGIDRKRNRE